MTKSPSDYSEDEILEIIKLHSCKSRLADGKVEVLDAAQFAESVTANTGAVDYRFEQRTSKDGTVILQADVYVFNDRREEEFIVSLEVDGKEHWVRYDRPRPIR